ncbi:hypothetical protein NF700_05650 [Sphingomonadaceae bacterium OTU29MARTA1]|nr:hypothetical protein NF700_05650 [Sphingomonadaceae bacterium OTU29MARTA1]
MRWTIVLAGSALLTGCGSASSDGNSATTAADEQANRAVIAQRAENPDFRAVDALANWTGEATPGQEPANSAIPTTAASTLPVVTDPRAAMKAAIQVSASGSDGIKTLPLSPDLLVALRRVEARGEVGNYDHDFLTGGQEPLPVRMLGSTSRRTASGIEVTHRIESAAGPRKLTSVWSPRGDGSWQLDDIRAEGTTLLTLLDSDGA